ncbi:two-component system regulatory protein YycI [Metabacillus litoralis]|uniref:two-component system regulatory protein YycI n=1 Tax=Metabacillus litoralis TaxID=152268 RepID=UPI001CFD8029|nr:two-component system regulatory protein YycI [Metabacillus litoralis]
MEWSKTKSIFILAFLILDIFLAIEFYELQYKSNYEIMKEATIEEKLAVENITYSKLPDIEGKSFYITAKSKEFTFEEVPKDQTLILTNTSNPFRSLKVKLNKPIPVPESNLENRINQLLKDYVNFGDKYKYWYTDEQTNSIICIQRYNGRNIFQSKDDHIGMVKFIVNENNEIVSYEQSMLEDIKEVEEKESAVPALKAIEALYNKNYLTTNSEVKNIQYGYYTHIPLTNQQILAPTWHIIVETDTNERKDFYVNALEGDVLQSTQ